MNPALLLWEFPTATTGTAVGAIGRSLPGEAAGQWVSAMAAAGRAASPLLPLLDANSLLEVNFSSV